MERDGVDVSHSIVYDERGLRWFQEAVFYEVFKHFLSLKALLFSI
jgi:hypothetical protein